MTENEIAKEIVDASFEIHTKLGPGLFESVYEEVLFHELDNRGFFLERQVEVPIFWNQKKMRKGFVADLIIEESVIVEIKSVEKLANAHYKQLLTYLKLTHIKLGLLINFNEAYIKNGIKRIVNNL
ncbi:GxxExxY protein [Chitinophagales bacterium]|nr:GxxExxY protein [Chitinophagales bacterium]